MTPTEKRREFARRVLETGDRKLAYREVYGAYNRQHAFKLLNNRDVQAELTRAEPDLVKAGPGSTEATFAEIAALVRPIEPLPPPADPSRITEATIESWVEKNPSLISALAMNDPRRVAFDIAIRWRQIRTPLRLLPPDQMAALLSIANREPPTPLPPQQTAYNHLQFRPPTQAQIDADARARRPRSSPETDPWTNKPRR